MAATVRKLDEVNFFHSGVIYATYGKKDDPIYQLRLISEELDENLASQLGGVLSLELDDLGQIRRKVVLANKTAIYYKKGKWTVYFYDGRSCSFRSGSGYWVIDNDGGVVDVLIVGEERFKELFICNAAGEMCFVDRYGMPLPLSAHFEHLKPYY